MEKIFLLKLFLESGERIKENGGRVDFNCDIFDTL
jgi:hypothetical protein